MKIQKKDLIKEIATRAAVEDVFITGHYLPNPDPVLKRMGKDIIAYKEVLSDAHVSGCARRRKAAVKSLEWRITKTSQDTVNQLIENMFNNLSLNKIIGQMMNASLFGYCVLEVIWGYKNGKFLPLDLVEKPQHWFMFDMSNRLVMRSYNERGFVELPDKKFLLLTQDADYMNPYGVGDLSKCFWAATFKKGGLKFWLEFIEKYATPWVVGKHPRTASSLEIEEMLDALEQMQGASVSAIPNDSSIDIIESASKGGSSDAHARFLEFCKSEISLALLGQDQTTSQETTYASAKAGLEVLETIRNEDAKMVEEAMNCLIQWVVGFNFGSVQMPRFELYEQESIDKLQAERDELLARTGIRFTKKYYQKNYALEEEDIQELEDLELNQSVRFSEKDNQKTSKDVLLEPIKNELNQQASLVYEKWIDSAKKLLDQSDSLEHFQELLIKHVDEFSLDEYAQLIGLANMTATMAGRASVVEESQK